MPRSESFWARFRPADPLALNRPHVFDYLRDRSSAPQPVQDALSWGGRTGLQAALEESLEAALDAPMDTMSMDIRGLIYGAT